MKTWRKEFACYPSSVFPSMKPYSRAELEPMSRSVARTLSIMVPSAVVSSSDTLYTASSNTGGLSFTSEIDRDT